MMKLRSLTNYFFVVVSLMSMNSLAQDNEVITMEDTVIGNQEQPKVLYIVPWKSATDNDILSLPVQSKMTDVFDHVDRTEHQRHVQFLESLQSLGETDFLENHE